MPPPSQPPATARSSSERDQLYAHPREHIADFAFDERVARVFDDMIGRSVPGYHTILKMTGMLAARHALAGTRCYDLGCSLGAGALAMATGIQVADCPVIAVDQSAAMLERARELLGRTGQADRAAIQLVEADVREQPIERASLVALNFTLQFIPRPERDALLNRIGRGLRPGGVLILSEKIRFDDPWRDALHTDYHHAYKQANGYSELEIAQKRSALEDVLVPETLAAHRQRLQQAGFQRVETWFRCFNFVSLLAWR